MKETPQIMATKKNNHIRTVNRWTGYYVEDTDCSFCIFFQGRKLGCSLPVCCCLEEKTDAAEHGRIKRKPGSLKWYK